VLSLRELVLARPDTTVRDLSREPVAVEPLQDQEEAARILSRYGLVAIPVVDEHKRLLGVITVDDIIDVLEEETTEDISRLGGSEPLDLPYLHSPDRLMIKKRIGWLVALFFAQWLTATIMVHYRDVLSSAIALSFFIPLLIDTGGNAGSQAATLLVRALALEGRLDRRQFRRVIGRELVVGLLLGLIMAALALLRVLSLDLPLRLALTVSLATLTVITGANAMGALLPFLALRLRVDPAVATGPVLTTLVDAGGLMIYFTTAVWLLNLGSA